MGWIVCRFAHPSLNEGLDVGKAIVVNQLAESLPVLGSVDREHRHPSNRTACVPSQLGAFVFAQCVAIDLDFLDLESADLQAALSKMAGDGVPQQLTFPAEVGRRRGELLDRELAGDNGNRFADAGPDPGAPSLLDQPFCVRKTVFPHSEAKPVEDAERYPLFGSRPGESITNCSPVPGLEGETVELMGRENIRPCCAVRTAPVRLSTPKISRRGEDT